MLTYTFGKQHIYSSFKNEFEKTYTKIYVSVFNNYTVLNNDTDTKKVYFVKIVSILIII